MKTFTSRSFFLQITILIIAVPTLAQDTTDVPSKRSLFMTYDGSSFESIGLKYRLSDTFTIFGQLSFDFVTEKSNGTQERESDREAIGFGFGLQSAIIRNSKGSLYIVCSATYSSDKFTDTDPPSDNAVYTHETTFRQWDFDIGPGVEFQLSEWFSISGQHVLRIFTERSSVKTTTFPEERNGRATGVIWGIPTIVVAFFF